MMAAIVVNILVLPTHTTLEITFGPTFSIMYLSLEHAAMNFE